MVEVVEVEQRAVNRYRWISNSRTSLRTTTKEEVSGSNLPTISSSSLDKMSSSINLDRMTSRRSIGTSNNRGR